MYGPLNAAFPRISPGREISGHFIPKGTIVSTPSYATSRDSKVFANPDVYTPNRWLNASKQMKEMSRPFSYGPRNCIGKHLAQIGLTLTLARLYQLCDIENDPSMTMEMMRPKDRGVIAPWDAKFFIRPTLVHAT